MGGCDKTTPGLVMGAFSAGLPMIYLPAGPMLRGNFRGDAPGSRAGPTAAETELCDAGFRPGRHARGLGEQ